MADNTNFQFVRRMNTTQRNRIRQQARQVQQIIPPPQIPQQQEEDETIEMQEIEEAMELHGSQYEEIQNINIEMAMEEITQLTQHTQQQQKIILWEEEEIKGEEFLFLRYQGLELWDMGLDKIENLIEETINGEETLGTYTQIVKEIVKKEIIIRKVQPIQIVKKEKKEPIIVKKQFPQEEILRIKEKLTVIQQKEIQETKIIYDKLQKDEKFYKATRDIVDRMEHHPKFYVYEETIRRLEKIQGDEEVQERCKQLKIDNPDQQWKDHRGNERQMDIYMTKVNRLPIWNQYNQQKTVIMYGDKLRCEEGTKARVEELAQQYGRLKSEEIQSNESQFQIKITFNQEASAQQFKEEFLMKKTYNPRLYQGIDCRLRKNRIKFNKLQRLVMRSYQDRTVEINYPKSIKQATITVVQSEDMQTLERAWRNWKKRIKMV